MDTAMQRFKLFVLLGVVLSGNHVFGADSSSSENKTMSQVKQQVEAYEQAFLNDIRVVLMRDFDFKLAHVYRPDGDFGNNMTSELNRNVILPFYDISTMIDTHEELATLRDKGSLLLAKLEEMHACWKANSKDEAVQRYFDVTAPAILKGHMKSSGSGSNGVVDASTTFEQMKQDFIKTIDLDKNSHGGLCIYTGSNGAIEIEHLKKNAVEVEIINMVNNAQTEEELTKVKNRYDVICKIIECKSPRMLYEDMIPHVLKHDLSLDDKEVEAFVFAFRLRHSMKVHSHSISARDTDLLSKYKIL